MSDDKQAKAAAALPLLRAENFSVEGEKEPYRIAGLFDYWPSTDTWRRAGGRRTGYGYRELIRAVRQAQANTPKDKATE